MNGRQGQIMRCGPIAMDPRPQTVRHRLWYIVSGDSQAPKSIHRPWLRALDP